MTTNYHFEHSLEMTTVIYRSCSVQYCTDQVCILGSTTSPVEGATATAAQDSWVVGGEGVGVEVGVGARARVGVEVGVGARARVGVEAPAYLV